VFPVRYELNFFVPCEVRTEYLYIVTCGVTVDGGWIRN
jgi:hypothetical protein